LSIPRNARLETLYRELVQIADMLNCVRIRPLSTSGLLEEVRTAVEPANVVIMTNPDRMYAPGDIMVNAETGENGTFTKVRVRTFIESTDPTFGRMGFRRSYTFNDDDTVQVYATDDPRATRVFPTLQEGLTALLLELDQSRADLMRELQLQRDALQFATFSAAGKL